MTTEAATLMTRPTDPTGEAPRRRRGTDESGVAALAFESMLDSTRTLVRAETQRAERVAPAQMFEAPAAETKEHRQASVEEEQQSQQVDARREMERDPNGVATRRQAQGPVGDGRSPAPTTDDAPHAQPARDVPVSTGARVTQSGPQFVRPSQGRTDLTTGTAATSRTVSEAPPVKDNVAGPPSASIVTGAPAVVVTPASMPSVAQQVGELLGATRVGDVESGQAASSASTTGDARANTPAQKSPAPARSSEGPTTQASSPRPEEVETKEASAFERLVRSIRLQTGLRSSSARLQLHPPELGEVRVDVRLAGEHVEIDVRTETDAARETLSHRSDELKTALQHHGIHVDRLDVTVHAPPDPHHGLAGYDAQRNPSGRGSSSQSGGGEREDGGATSMNGDVPEAEAVAEARLDIRV
ncbi:MAG: flagellar hook-length control protein FliK [Planctomycetota bacterium]